MQTCTEKVSIFGVVKSSNVYLQSLRNVKNMHLHGNPGSTYEHCWMYSDQMKEINMGGFRHTVEQISLMCSTADRGHSMPESSIFLLFHHYISDEAHLQSRRH